MRFGQSCLMFNGLATALFVVFCLVAVSAKAQQLVFERSQLPDSDDTNFSYTWQPSNSQPRTLQFEVNQTEFLAPFKRFRNYNKKRANRELFQQLNRYIRQQNWRGVEVSLAPREQQLSINVREARDSQQQQRYRQQAERLRQYYRQRWQDYLQSNYYRHLTLPSGEQGIIPDAVAIARQQEPLFNPLVNAIGETLRDNSRRGYTDFIAQFIQAIPYNALDDGIDNRGDGFLPPNQVIFYNQGDCDSKASLMSSLLRPIIPSAKMAIVYLPGHALFAIAMAPQPDDSIITVEGTKMVLVEVAGPAQMPAGQIASQSQFYIDNGQYRTAAIN